MLNTLDVNYSSQISRHSGYRQRQNSRYKPNINNRRYLPNNSKTCQICFGYFCKNAFVYCPCRGSDFLPRWVTKNAARYNVLDKKLPPSSYIDQDIPLRASTHSPFSKNYKNSQNTPKINNGETVENSEIEYEFQDFTCNTDINESSTQLHGSDVEFSSALLSATGITMMNADTVDQCITEKDSDSEVENI